MKKYILLILFIVPTLLYAQSNEWRQIGLEYLVNNLPEKAIPFLRQAAISEPLSGVLRAELAYAYQLSGDYDSAFSEYTLATGLVNAPLADIEYNLGQIYAQEEKWSEAIFHYTRTLELDDQYTEAILNRAVMEVHQNNYRAAEKDYRDFLLLEPETNQKVQIEAMIEILANLRDFPVGSLDKSKYQEKQLLEEQLNNSRERLNEPPPSNRYLGEN